MIMNKQEIDKNLKQLNGWQLKEGNKIFKEYMFEKSETAVKFLNDIGNASNKEGHHPVATWVYDKVSIMLWTHSVNGLTENDFKMAEKFDEIYRKYN